MRWDGIGASLRDVEAGHVADTIRRDLSGILVRSPMRRRRYGSVFDIDVGGRQAAWVGFDEGNGLVYVEGKGETSPDLVDCIRCHWPDHSAARLDSCEDYKAPGAFEALQSVIRTSARAAGRGRVPDLGFRALPDDPVKGRTWGSMCRGGVAHLRLYESGKMADRLHLGPDAVRVEGEFRPHTAAEKRAAATMTPLQVWGLTGWTHRVVEALAKVEVPRFQAPVSPYTQERTTLYLARTFRRHWESLLSDFGDWECIGRELQEVWRLDDEAEASAKRNEH